MAAFVGSSSDSEELLGAPAPRRQYRRVAALAAKGLAAVAAAAALSAKLRGTPLRGGAGVVGLAAAPAARQSGFATGPTPETRTFAWSAPKRTLLEAYDLTFADKAFEAVKFAEGSAEVTKESLLQWVDKELIGGADPFADFAGKVPVPFPPQGAEPADQVPPGHWVSYSRRQLCFIAAKTLTGCNTEGYANGFLRFLETKAPYGCTPTNGEFGRAVWELLAACSADPTLAKGAQGPSVVVAKAEEKPEVADVRAKLGQEPLSDAGLRVCQYADGTAPLKGVATIPEAACKQPTEEGPGRDFMTGGLKGQGLVDISAQWLGGYIWGYACGIGGGQDERLMTYMPEVFLLAFFLSESPGTNPQLRHTPQLRQPSWILGARKIFDGLDGTARFNLPLKKNPSLPMTTDLVDVTIDGKAMKVSGSQPFLAFMSENQDFEISDGCANLPSVDCDRGCRTRLARENRNPWQRAVEPSCPYSFGNQVRAWYASTALTSYSEQIRPALKSIVKSMGTGPFGSGLWWGDSQVFALVMLIAHTATAQTWGKGADLPLDYYIYSAFTENPGNQCFVHGGDQCKACLKQCGTPPSSAYWIPGFAYSHVDPDFKGWGAPDNKEAKACVDTETSCGQAGLEDVIAAYKDEMAAKLWDDVERVLRGGASGHNVGRNVFDELLATKGQR